MTQTAMRMALEALENSVDLVIQDAYNAEQLYGNYPARQAKVGGLKLLAEDHQKAITALRQALANQALDKKAENARELGLDYYVPCCKNQTCAKCVAAKQPAAWVALTDEKIDELARTMVKGNKSVNWLARAIEAKLKENT